MTEIERQLELLGRTQTDRLMDGHRRVDKHKGKEAWTGDRQVGGQHLGAGAWGGPAHTPPPGR